MTLLVEKGTFNKTTSTAVPVDQTVTLSNGSLTPKLVILWTDGQTTNDGTYVDDARLSYGFSDGTNDACQALRVDESAETEAYTFHNNAVIAIINLTTNAIVSQGDISAFNAGDFHINWSVQSDTNAQVIHYIVAGGTDITNVSCVSTTVGTTGTGNTAFTGSGTVFTPDFALTMTGADSYVTANTITTSSDDALFCIGAAKSTSKEWVMWGRDETFGTSDCDMYLDPDACVAACDVGTGAITFLGNFVQFDNAAGGGITINITNGADATTKKLAFLFVKGGQWDCGAFQQRDGTGTQNVTIASGLDPEIVFLGGINTASSATVTANNHIAIGASDGTNEGCSYFGNTNGLGTYAAVNSNLNTKVYRMATPHATPASSTTNAECDMTGMSTAGQFTLDWTTADSTQRRMAYWVLGTISSTAFERAPATETVSLSESIARSVGFPRVPETETVTSSESITRMLAATRNPIETTDLTETLTRLLTAQRIIDTETTTITDDVQRVKGIPRSIDAETVTMSDSVTRKLEATRTLQEDTIISESLTRLLAATRTLVTETVPISDLVERVRGAVATIATEVVAISDSVVRMLAATRTLTEDTIISYNVSRLLAATRLLSDTVLQSDSLNRLLAATRTLSDTIVVSDSVARLSAASRTFIENTSISESLNRLLAATRTLSDTTTINEQVNRLLGAMRTFVENTSISDSLSWIVTPFGTGTNYVRTIIQNISISDSVTRIIAPSILLRKIRRWMTLKYSIGDPSL